MTRVVSAAIPYYQPVTVCDPCVGSGVMLLASAATYEPWMVQMGLVQFYAQDIDMAMVRLVKINCALYGLNSYGCDLTHSFAVNARVCFK
jgi:type I restriction-modification system DNA methylase subunit